MSNLDENKPEIITRTAWGGKNSVSLGGNRYSIKSESLFRAANFVALPSRGLVVDAAFWIASAATALRLAFSLMASGLVPHYLGLVVLALILLPPMGAIGMVADALPNHRPDCWARVLMLTVAVLIASNFFWSLPR